MPRIQVRLTDEELRTLTTLAKAAGKSPSETLRDIVRVYADQTLRGRTKLPTQRQPLNARESKVLDRLA